MVYACFNRQHRLTDLMARGDPLDQVVARVGKRPGFRPQIQVRPAGHFEHPGFSYKAFAAEWGAVRPSTRRRSKRRGAPGAAFLSLPAFTGSCNCRGTSCCATRREPLSLPPRRSRFSGRARLNLQSMDYCFYHSLAIAAVFEGASPERRAELREDLIEHLASFSAVGGELSGDFRA